MDDKHQTMSEECATCGAGDDILFTCGYCGGTFCSDHGLPNHSCEELSHPEEADEGVAFEWEADGHTDPDDPFTESGFQPATDEGAGGREPRPVEPAPAATSPAPRRPEGSAVSATAAVRRSVDDPGTPAVRRAPRPVDGSAIPAVRPAPRSADDSAAPAVRPVPRSIEPATPAVERRPRPVVGEATPAVRPRPRRLTGRTRPAVRAAPEPSPATDSDPSPAETAGTAGSTDETSAATTDGGHAETSIPMRTMDATRSPGSVERQEPRTLVAWLDQQTYVSLSVKTAALAAAINGALYFGMALTLYGLHPF